MSACYWMSHRHPVLNLCSALKWQTCLFLSGINTSVIQCRMKKCVWKCKFNNKKPFWKSFLFEVWWYLAVFSRFHSVNWLSIIAWHVEFDMVGDCKRVDEFCMEQFYVLCKVRTWPRHEFFKVFFQKERKPDLYKWSTARYVFLKTFAFGDHPVPKSIT
jgi:hypothetical protein